VVCDVDFSDRWLRAQNPTPDAGTALQYGHRCGP